MVESCEDTEKLIESQQCPLCAVGSTERLLVYQRVTQDRCLLIATFTILQSGNNTLSSYLFKYLMVAIRQYFAVVWLYFRKVVSGWFQVGI